MRTHRLLFVFILLLAACTPDFSPEQIDFESDPRILRGAWTGAATLDFGVSPLVYSPDGSRLFFNKVAVKNAVYDTEALAEVTRLELPDGTGVAQFSPDNEGLATATVMNYEEKNAVSLWNARTGERLASFPVEGEVLRFSQDLERYVTKVPASQFEGEEVVVWDTRTQERFASLALPDVPESYYARIEISSDLSTVATCEDRPNGGEPLVKLVTVESGAAQLSFSLSSAVYCSEVLLSPDGSLLAVSDGRGTQIWEVAKRELLSNLSGATQPLALSSDNQRLVSRQGNNARLWDVQTSTPLKDIVVGDTWGYGAFDPQLSQLAWQDAGSQLQILALNSGDALTSITLSEPLRIELDLTATYVDKTSYEVSGTLLYDGASYSVQSDVSGGGGQEYIRPTTSPEEYLLQLDASDAEGEVRWVLEGPAPYYAYRDGKPQLDEVLFSGNISRPGSDEPLPRAYLLEPQP